MIGRRRRARSPDRAHRRAVPDNAGDNPAGDSADEAGLVGFAAATQGRVTRAQRWLVKYQDVPVVDVVLGTFRKDRRAAGSVMSSALAFRLFLFCLPLLLLTIGVAGFASDVVDARSANRVAGLSGGLAKQVTTAFHESGLTRWAAVLFGLWGVLVAGRSLPGAVRGQRGRMGAAGGRPRPIPRGGRCCRHCRHHRCGRHYHRQDPGVLRHRSRERLFCPGAPDLRDRMAGHLDVPRPGYRDPVRCCPAACSSRSPSP